MIRNPESDTKVLSLPNAEPPQTPRLDIQAAANFLAGAQRLNEILSLPGEGPNTMTAEQSKEAQAIRSELGHFVSAHAVNLVQGWLQAAAILAPLQSSLASIIGPCVAKALADAKEVK